METAPLKVEHLRFRTSERVKHIDFPDTEWEVVDLQVMRDNSLRYGLRTLYYPTGNIICERTVQGSKEQRVFQQEELTHLSSNYAELFMLITGWALGMKAEVYEARHYHTLLAESFLIECNQLPKRQSIYNPIKTGLSESIKALLEGKLFQHRSTHTKLNHYDRSVLTLSLIVAEGLDSLDKVENILACIAPIFHRFNSLRNEIQE